MSAPNLRCFLVTDTLDVGGSEEVVAFLARRLPERGIDTMVVYTGFQAEPAGRLASALRAEGVKIAGATESTAAELIADHRPQVISAHGPPAWWGELAFANGIPYVETLHGMHSFFDDAVDWREESVRSARVSRFIAVSELVRQQYLVGNAGMDPARVVTVPNSVDQLRMPPLDRNEYRTWLGLEDEFLFVSLARYTLQKNTYGLVRAFADVAASHPEAHLLVAGRPDDASYPYQVRRLRDGVAARDRIHLRDHAPWPQAVLAAADGFVLDSFFEGWSLASMEALCSGLPVVLSDVGGAREQVGGGGERGHLVANPLGNPLAAHWTSVRESLYADQSNRKELVSAMCAVVEERALWVTRREELRAESSVRFHPDRALNGHAEVLRSAAQETTEQTYRARRAVGF